MSNTRVEISLAKPVVASALDCPYLVQGSSDGVVIITRKQWDIERERAFRAEMRIKDLTAKLDAYEKARALKRERSRASYRKTTLAKAAAVNPTVKEILRVLDDPIEEPAAKKIKTEPALNLMKSPPPPSSVSPLTSSVATPKGPDAEWENEYAEEEYRRTEITREQREDYDAHDEDWLYYSDNETGKCYKQLREFAIDRLRMTNKM